MPSPRTLAQVVPTTSSIPRDRDEEESRWQFELRPAHDLPVVDLSVSLRSRFLTNRRLVQYTKSCGKHSVVAFIIGIMLVVVMFVVQNDTQIQALAPVAATLVLPAPILGISVLRYAMVRLLVKTYDFWFFFACNFGFLVSASVVLGDASVLAAVAFWCGTFLNILVDASLRGARSMVIVNASVLVSSTVFLVCFKLEWIKSMRSPVLIRYGAYALPARGFAVSSLVTLMAMVIRNTVYTD